MEQHLIKRFTVGHAGIALVIALSTATGVIALRGVVHQNELASQIDGRLALLEHLRSDAREIARSARRYLLTGDLKEQQRVFAIESEMDTERKQLGPVAQPLDRAFEDYASAIVRSMSADRTNAGAALATFEEELLRVRNALGDSFDAVVARERAARDAARSSQRLARGAQWALLFAGGLGLLLTVGGVFVAARLVRRQSTRIREAESIAERSIAARRELLAASKDLRTPLERIITQTSHLRTSAREEHQLELLQSISTAASQVDYMLRELLDITAIQAGTVSLRRERSDVAQLVDRAIRLRRDKAHQRGIRLRYESQLSLVVDADRDRIVHALAAFIAMAIARARIGAEIVVSAVPCDEGVRFLIEDARMADPAPGFETLTAPAPVHDLSLHLSQRVIEAHGGRVATDTAAVGRFYSFTLPTEPTLLR